jgi:hypothetical protein
MERRSVRELERDRHVDGDASLFGGRQRRAGEPLNDTAGNLTRPHRVVHDVRATHLASGPDHYRDRHRSRRGGCTESPVVTTLRRASEALDRRLESSGRSAFAVRAHATPCARPEERTVPAPDRRRARGCARFGQIVDLGRRRRRRSVQDLRFFDRSGRLGWRGRGRLVLRARKNDDSDDTGREYQEPQEVDPSPARFRGITSCLSHVLSLYENYRAEPYIWLDGAGGPSGRPVARWTSVLLDLSPVPEHTALRGD